MSRDILTTRQTAVLKAISYYLLKEKRAPTVRELCELIGVNAPRTATQFLESLESKGFIKRGKGARNIKILKRPTEKASSTVMVPVVGTAVCGTPVLSEEFIDEYIQISEALAPKPHTYFILQLRGNSMDKAGLQPGGTVLVRQQAHAKSNEIVVALIDDEVTIKRYLDKKTHIVLQPESSNPDNKPIIMERDFQVQGIVVCTL